MKISQGKDDIIPRDKWITPEDLHGEEKVLNSPLMMEAFNFIIENYSTNNKIAFISLCTTSRPYYKSYKWYRIKKDFKKYFSIGIDLLVCSNGGIIPEKYWESYPYLSYDAHREPEYDDLYKDKLYERMIKFFSNIRFDYVIADFRPTQRNRTPVERALKVLKNEGIIIDYFISPSIEIFEKMKGVKEYKGFTAAGNMFPTFNPMSYYELIHKI